jgi:hypothetical protein
MPSSHLTVLERELAILLLKVDIVRLKIRLLALEEEKKEAEKS